MGGSTRRIAAATLAAVLALLGMPALTATAASPTAQDLPPTAQDLPPTAQDLPPTAQDRTLTREELGLQVTVGYSPDASAVGWVPVEVRMAPTRLFGGTIEVLARPDGHQVIERRDVEVAAGTEKVYRFVVPPSDIVQLRIDEPGRDPLGTTVSVPSQQSASFLVGVLAEEVPADPPVIAAVASDIRGVYAAIDPAWLDVSARALDGVSTLVVTASDLAQLGDTARRHLHNALVLGTELVVVADQPGPLDLQAAGLPASPAVRATPATVVVEGRSTPVLELTSNDDAWALTAADVDAASGDDVVLVAATSVGRGRLSVIGVGLGEPGLGRLPALWGHVLQPSTRLLETSDSRSLLSRSLFLAEEAVRSQGLTLPSLPWLTAFLVAFVLLVGPVNGFVLDRLGRRELAWVTIPVITLVFAGGAYVGARGAAPPVGLAGTVSYWIDGEGEELTVAAMRSPREGEHEVTFPGDGWSVVPAARTAQPAVVDRSSGDTTARMELGSLQVGTTLGWRPTDRPAPLEVTATAVDGDTLTISMRNRSTQDLTDIEVQAGTTTDRIGDLPAGEDTEVSLIGLRTLPLRQPWMEDFEGLRAQDGSPQPPRSLESLLRWSVLDGNPGLVWVVGTVATAHDLPRSSGGETVDVGGVVAVGVTPGVSGARTLPPTVVARSLLPPSTNRFFDRSAPTAINSPGTAVLRYRLPGGVRVDELITTLDRGVLEGQVMGRGECFVEPMIGPDGQVIGEQEVCEDVAVPAPAQPLAPERPAVPDCPDDAECTLDGDLWEVCRETEDGRECTVSVLEDEPLPPDAFQRVQLEVFDHRDGRWVFSGQAVTVGPGGTQVLDPDRFLSPLGEVFVRAAGELFPFDYSGRGIGATLEVPA